MNKKESIRDLIIKLQNFDDDFEKKMQPKRKQFKEKIYQEVENIQKEIEKGVLKALEEQEQEIGA